MKKRAPLNRALARCHQVGVSISIDYFQPVPDDLVDGHKDELPIAPGFWDRRDLWRVWGYLAAVIVEGPVHLGKLTGALRTYM